MKTALLASLALTLATPGAFAVSQAEGGPLQAIDIFSLEMANDPQISPDGRWVAYQRRSNDIMTDQTRSAIWTAPYEGGANRPLVTGTGDYSAPRWSPDSSQIVFVANEDGETQLRKVWVDSGRSATLTQLPGGAGNLSWSPDGRWIAFTMFMPAAEPQVDIGMPDKPRGAEWAAPALVDETTRYEFDGAGELPSGYSQIFVAPADGGAPRQLTHVTDGSISGVSWGPDSQRLYYSLGGREADDFDFREADIYAIALDASDPVQITDFPGGESSPRISPDGDMLAYLSTPRREESNVDTDLKVMSLSGGEPRELLADLDRGFNQAEWDERGRGLWVSFDDRGHTVLGYAGLNGGLDRIRDDLGGMTFGRPYTSGAFSVSGNDRWAATLASAYDLANVGVGTRRGLANRLTDVNADVLGLRDLAEVERFTWASSADGQEIEGWIAYPPGFDPNQSYPMILEIHGGPHTAYGPQFSAEVQLYAAAGYVVLYTNPRGSTSYGEAFSNEIDKDYPGQDVDDLLSGVDALIARGFVDEDRLFVTGGSGGGVLTAQLIGVTDRFAAAAVGKPVINWVSFALAADIGPSIYRYWFGVTPWDDPETYWRRSPLSLVGNVETPALVFVGGEDRRTPVFEAEQYYNALQIRGIESRLVRIPGAYHGIADSRPSRLLQKTGHVLAWFEQYDPANAADAE
ncbi:MAG: peptidase S9 family protein [Oceanicaulis sp.]|uniref:S9 family peptidase n=1 Tax=unclassified Oceanicaulis TaxID=2632123 RepID=UPI000C423C3D|nr:MULTISPECIES: S9 family peptidase [unclassified Oceanicaulis]MBC40445.1 peptidase S9 family protein [Oceanicaulis sp.]